MNKKRIIVAIFILLFLICLFSYNKYSNKIEHLTTKSDYMDIKYKAFVDKQSGDEQLNYYMTLEKNGMDIQGNISNKDLALTGHEGQILVRDIEFSINSPIDDSSGLPTGTRQWDTVKVAVKADKTSPLLLNLILNSENIETLTIYYWQPTATGGEEKYQILELTDANMSSYKMTNQWLSLQFTFQKINLTSNLDSASKYTAADDWIQP